MPIYEYRCTFCGEIFDVLQRVGEDGHDLTCPACDEPRPEKLMSMFAASDSDGENSSFGCSASGFS